jgi:tetratricopeptide (TPR) repeat protein
MFIAGGNRSEAGLSLQALAEANRLTGHNLESIPLYERALRMFKETGDRELTGVTLNNLSLVLESEGQWNRAEQSYREAKANFDAVNDRANASAAIGNVADIEIWRGHLQQGAEMYRQAWELAASSGRARVEYAHIQYAALLLMRGEVEQARREIEPQIASLAAYRGDPWDWAGAIIVRGDIQKAAGELDLAHKSYQEALELLKNSNSSLASAQVALAELFLIEGDTATAERLLREAVATFEKDKSAGDAISGYTILARTELAGNNLVEAKRAVERAVRLVDLRQFPVMNLPLRLVQAEIGFAEAKQGSAGANDLASVTKEIRAVIQESHQLGLYKLESEARLALGKLQMSENLASGRAQLNALSSESRARGLQLIARQAQQALTRPRNLARTASSRR